MEISCPLTETELYGFGAVVSKHDCRMESPGGALKILGT